MDFTRVLCLVGLVHSCSQCFGSLQIPRLLRRLLFRPLGIPGGQAHTGSSGCTAGSLAAVVLSAAQGTQLLGKKPTRGTRLLLPLPVLPPAEMGFLCVETVWLLQGVDQHSKQAYLSPFCG